MRRFLLVLLVVAALFAACGKSTTIMIKDEAPWYFPAVLEIEPGTTVTFDNSMAAVVHPVNTLAGPVAFSSGHFTKTWRYTFTAPGLYHYYCPIHPYMQGFIGVGVKVPEETLPLWVTQWPPAAAEQPVPGGPPATPGLGEVWLDAQFQKVPGKDKPGTIVVVDVATWTVIRVIDDKRLNNPHNLMLTTNKNQILQTNWFDSHISVFDRYTGLLLKHLYIGESPAHVMTANGKAYVTLQGADGIAVLDDATFATLATWRTIEGEHGHGSSEAQEDKEAHGEAAPHEDDEAHEEEDMHEEGAVREERGRGPHGNWLSKDGARMSVANTEGGSLAVWDTASGERILEHQTDPVPLFAGLSQDGRRAWTASLLTGKFVAVDVDTKAVIKEFTVGKAPVQAVPSPDDAYILVALSGDGAVAVLDGRTFDLVKTLPTGSGAHAVSYGPKQGGGWYAYVSHKFVPWIAVIDMATLEVAGYIALPKASLGGQGILAVYD